MRSKVPLLTDNTTIEQAEKMGVAVSMEGRWRALEGRGVEVSEAKFEMTIHRNKAGEIVIPSWDIEKWNRGDVTDE